MRCLAPCFVGLLAVLRVLPIAAAEIDYLEDFALAKDRAAALQQLIAGTEDYDYYHCLHYLNTQQFDKVEKLLAAWIARDKDSPRIREIQNRQALLTYAQQPARSLEFIRKRLDVQFNHQRERLGEKPNLPTTLDPKAIDRQTLLDRALAANENLAGVEDAALDWLVGRELNAQRRRDLLERLTRPDYPQLVKLVIDDLAQRNSRGFGSLAIHRQLLLAQLDECPKRKPDLLNQQNFVNVYLTKLRPGADVDWRNDPAEARAYFARLEEFVQKLAPAANSLKAHVLYHRLALDQQAGVYDKARFLAYLRLPRAASYMKPEYLRETDQGRYPADLAANFQEFTLLPSAGDDEPLVRGYLQHFFTTETTFEPYTPYVSDRYLKRLFAETKLVEGIGDAAHWSAMLSPTEYQALKDRVDLDFAHTNRPRFGGSDPVALDLFVKNVRTLLVKVYEINTRNFYRQKQVEVNTDINLDGLVANQETVHEYSEPPLRRVSRHFEFPHLSRPGVYVIDFIGNGQSSRAVVRKGELRHTMRLTTAGHVFTVFDEQRRPRPQATLWFNGREYAPGPKGEIAVPFAGAPQRQTIVLQDGDFSWLTSFQHEAEVYSLRAGIYVDREALVRGHRATVLVRPQLTVSGVPATLAVLEDVRLVIRSTDHDGVASTLEVKDFKLREDREATHEFQVPQRLSQIQFVLKARVQNLSRNKKEDLSTERTFTLNQIDQTDKIEALHLVLSPEGYALDLLGKSGEAMADRPVRVSLKHRDFREAVEVTLQTDERGRVRLGRLEGIASVTARGPSDEPQNWPLVREENILPGTLHGAEGDVLEVPLPDHPASEKPSREELSLLELRGATFVADRFSALTRQGGLCRIAGLRAGDYDLWIKPSNQRLRIRIAAGPTQRRWVMGSHRQLELRGEHPVQIGAIVAGKDRFDVVLQNSSPTARLHVFATRYYPAWSAVANLGAVRDAEPGWQELRKLETLYVAGRDIGDEYRYILDRKQAKKFPGNMLERPSLLLNPWAVRGTETGQQQAAEGKQFAGQRQASSAAYGGSKAKGEHASGASGMFASLDFLAEASAVLVNLAPDERGVVSIPRSRLGGHQHLHFVAADPRGIAYRSAVVTETKPATVDLRLADGLDPKVHFAQQKRVTAVAAKQPFTIGDLASARVEMYDNLAKVYGLFVTLSKSNADLVEFGFVANWPSLKPDQKRAKYSKYACHELDFFLHQKDPEFFNSVVLPYLKNKKDPRFVDRWLLGHDLSAWLSPWNYEQLNVVERILLARQVAAARPSIIRDVQDRFALIPPDAERFQFLFETAMKGTALETGDPLGVEAVRKAAANGAKPYYLKDDVQMPRAKGGPGATSPLSAMRFGAAPATPAAPPLQRPARAAAPATAPAQSKPTEKEMSSVRRNRMGDDKADATAKDWAELEQLAEKLARKADGKRDEAVWADRLEPFQADLDLRAKARQFYRKLDKTQEWAENNYYHVPLEQQNADLITVNTFWRDYGRFEADRGFRSIHFAEASRNFSEMMLALAVLDLPFQAEKHQTRLEKRALTITPGSPMVVFHEEVKQVTHAKEPTPILVSQNFFRQGDRYIRVENEQRDKFVTDEFLVHVVYGCQVVVTNPTSSPQKLDVLVQIPRGAVPVQKGRETRSVHVDLQPYHTQTVEYYFYFPAAGSFAHYPVQVARREEVVTQAAPFTFKVVEKLSRIDRASWDYLSQFGSADEVLAYLEEANLHSTDLARIAFRMQDREFFPKAIAVLTRRHVYDHTLWSYGLKHNEPATVRQYLQHADAFVGQCGLYLDSPLLVLDPVARKTYQQLDYRPLVNARAHPLGARRQIVNDRLHTQYHQLLKVLSYHRELDGSQWMAVTYYLLLQDRIEEALAAFERVRAEALETRLQYDYFDAYLAFCRAEPEKARAVAAKYAAYPVDRWRDAFAAITAQLGELGGRGTKVVDPESRGEVQGKLAATEPSFDFQVESKRLQLQYQNLEKVTVNYYLMDIELLFSRNPFVQQHTGQFQHIRPNASQVVELPAGRTAHTIDLPKAFHQSNVLVEIDGGGVVKSQATYANALAVQVAENYGQVHVRHRETGRGLAKVYVKVYARMKDGRVAFYKDGYTDLRGRFDYASLSTNELDFVERFALLVLSEEHGAVVREAGPPQR